MKQEKTVKKGILIVGAGILQIAAVEKAKELGYFVYITDLNDKAPAVRYADKFFKLSIKDVKGHVQLAKKLKRENRIIAVYTQGCEAAYTVAMAAKVAGLPGIDPQAALNCDDKIETRTILNRKKIDLVRFVTAKNEKEAAAAVKRIGFPCVVKPADNSASRGLTVLCNEPETAAAFNGAMEKCFQRKEVIIEEFLNGPEYSVDTVLYRGKLYPAGISDRLFRPIEKYSVQIGSLTPSLLPAEIQLEMYRLMDKAAGALGVDNGAFKGDLILVNGRPKIIEVTARTSGGFDSQYRKPYSFGIDLLKATMDIAAGKPLDPLDLIPKWCKWSKTTTVFTKPGIIQSITGVEKLKKQKGVKNIFLFVKAGDEIKDYKNCADRVGQIVIVADTYEELIEVEEVVQKTLRFETEVPK